MDASSDEPSNLEQLVTRVARSQDRDAFADLFRHFAPRLAGFFARGGLDPAARDELVQEAMLRVWRSAGQFDAGRGSATTWVFTIARNVRIDHQRRPATRNAADALDPSTADPAAPRADEVLADRRRALEVRAALDQLPPEQSQVLEAAYFEHKTLQTIASEWGLALGTVKSRVRLAFQRLRTTLGEDL
jgi:RNA polymerase sigma-70 factor, ECF subfamily